MAAVFDRVASDYGSDIGYFEEFGRRLVTYAGVRPGMRVLDVAAGKGASARPARDLGCEVVAVDLAPAMVASLAADGFDARLMDAEALAFDDQSFDAVVCGFAVMFFPDPVAALRQFRRVVRTGGPVACSVPKRVFPAFVYALREEFGPKAAPAKGDAAMDLDVAAAMAEAGFGHVATAAVEAEFTLASGQALWDFMVSTGVRGLLDRLSPKDGAELQRRTVQEAGDGPVVITPSARYWLASG